MRTSVAATFAVGIGLWLADIGEGYWRNGPRWPSGSIVMHLQLGSTSGSFIDGTGTWNSKAENALSIWNTNIGRVSFQVVRDSSSGISYSNGINNVFWDDNIYGDSFGSDTLAITLYRYRVSDSTLTEADVVFNLTKEWNSYRGNVRSGLNDIRRVALHEFGHVLGLGHPDEHGQSVSALMNSRISNLDSLQTDDIDGARAMYGSSAPPANRSPSVTASCSPCTVESGISSSLRATATDPDGDSLTYQWSAAQGSFSSSTSESTTWNAPLQPATVLATVTVRDSRGASASATVTLTVVFRDRLRVSARLLPGQALVSPSAQYRLVYQTDGNLVLYDDVARRDLWSTNTALTSAGFLTVQPDGNLVLYNAQSRDMWSSGTSGDANAYLVVQNDGNVVLYRANGQPLWDRISRPGGAPGLGLMAP